MIAAIGKQLKQSVNVFHNLILYLLLPEKKNFLEISPWLCYHKVPAFPDWQNSAVFSQRYVRCFIIFKVTSKLFWIKICNNKGVSFEQKFTFSTKHKRKTSLSVSTLCLQIWRCCIVRVPTFTDWQNSLTFPVFFAIFPVFFNVLFFLNWKFNPFYQKMHSSFKYH